MGRIKTKTPKASQKTKSLPAKTLTAAKASRVKGGGALVGSVDPLTTTASVKTISWTK